MTSIGSLIGEIIGQQMDSFQFLPPKISFSNIRFFSTRSLRSYCGWSVLEYFANLKMMERKSLQCQKNWDSCINWNPEFLELNPIYI
ncbi:hypothetical protein SAMN04488039_10540 [Sulfitobacter dubius]|nr:hypothetical protein SAMN04488039_10540 [Sulfitobacter dubius]